LLFILVALLIGSSIAANTKGASNTSNRISTYFEGKSYDVVIAERFLCDPNDSLNARCLYPLTRSGLMGFPSMVALSFSPKKSCLPPPSGTPLAKMHISTNGVNFIVGYEGNAGMLPPSKMLTGDIYGLYEDGEGNCTVGIGHLVHEGPCISKDISSHKKTFPNGETIADALRQLKEDLTFVEKNVNDNVKVQLTQYQFDALVDFTFNEGVNHLKRSILLIDINAGRCDATTITNDFQRYTRHGALLHRRNDEVNLFSNGVYPFWDR
jgi:GH24 family phage-related lysozyme (muramidase)